MKRLILLISFLLTTLFVVQSCGVSRTVDDRENQLVQWQESTIYSRLELLCAENYKSFFGSRTYKENSISISMIELIATNPNTYRVQGFHTYYGFLGAVYEDAPFQAIITFLDERGKRMHFKFYKHSSPDLLHPKSYWEKGEKTMTFYEY